MSGKVFNCSFWQFCQRFSHQTASASVTPSVTVIKWLKKWDPAWMEVKELSLSISWFRWPLSNLCPSPKIQFWKLSPRNHVRKNKINYCSCKNRFLLSRCSFRGELFLFLFVWQSSVIFSHSQIQFSNPFNMNPNLHFYMIPRLNSIKRKEPFLQILFNPNLTSNALILYYDEIFWKPYWTSLW